MFNSAIVRTHISRRSPLLSHSHIVFDLSIDISLTLTHNHITSFPLHIISPAVRPVRLPLDVLDHVPPPAGDP